MVKCESAGCDAEARVAIRTTRPSRAELRPSRAELRSTIWYDERAAPKAASRYCRDHGATLAGELVIVLAAA